MYEIEKDVPIHNLVIGYPFADMEIGDSFFMKALEGEDNSPRKLRDRVLRQARKYRFQESASFKIATRLFKDGVRIWRIK